VSNYDQVIRSPQQDVDASVYEKLEMGDILFIDNSHRSFANSDVTVAFTEVVPSLKNGVIFGFHDIFLPYDYPNEWSHRFYNEQYLLAMYLLGGHAGDDIVFPGVYVSYAAAFAEAVRLIFDGVLSLEGIERHAGAFWMRRRHNG